MDQELNKQFKRLNRKEEKILNKRENKFLKSTIDPIMNQLEEKIPNKLKETLEKAFLKAFHLVFEKGHSYIEKTYKKDEIQLEHDLNNYAIDKRLSKKYIKRLDKQANAAKMINTSLTVLEGGILGLLGIGLPDIPLFIAVIMRTIYEVALSYGYDYKSDEEKAYILYLICGAMTKGETQRRFNKELNSLACLIDQKIITEINLKVQMEETAKILSEAMLVGKFLQGIPVVGVVGGAVNYTIIKRIGNYASIKYKKRYLLKKAREKQV
jgi:hypothetical protein